MGVAMEEVLTVARDPTPTTPTLLTGDRAVSHFDRDPFVDASVVLTRLVYFHQPCS